MLFKKKYAVKPVRKCKLNAETGRNKITDDKAQNLNGKKTAIM